MYCNYKGIASPDLTFLYILTVKKPAFTFSEKKKMLPKFAAAFMNEDDNRKLSPGNSGKYTGLEQK